jgi:5-methylcytosine-specific restriction endonuclease McrA
MRATPFDGPLFTACTYQKPPGRGHRLPKLIAPGTKVARLTATDTFGFKTRRDGRQRCFQLFLCDCGGELLCIPGTVVTGNTSSCGCAHTETAKALMTTHGATVDRSSEEYRRYRANLTHVRRAKIIETAFEQISPEQYAKLLEEHSHKCWICEQPARLVWDHVQPLAKGGTHTVDNLRPACGPCNSRKSDLWPFTDARREQIAEEVRALRASLSAISDTDGLEVSAHVIH